MRLFGQVALVTGSEINIGRGIALRLAREGARIVINGIAPERVDTVVAEIRAEGGEAIGCVADVSDEAQVDAMFAALTLAYGKLDILVNNAALAANPSKHFLEQEPADWDLSMAVNARGLFLCSRLAARMMAAASGGRIINISSLGATRAHRSNVPYDATKGLMEAATRSMALDLAPYGITVNAVAPGNVFNHRNRNHPPEVLADRARTVPLGRIGLDSDVAGVVAFLSSEDAAYMTGQVLAVDGGMGIQLRPPQLDMGTELPAMGKKNAL